MDPDADSSSFVWFLLSWYQQKKKKNLDTGGKLELSGEPFPGKNQVRERRFGEYYPLEQKKYETEIQNSEGKQITNEEVWIGNERT